MTKDEIIEFLKEHKSSFANDFGIKRLALFGSYARDEADKDSDIDILVDMPSSFKKFYAFKYFLEDNLKKSVDLGLEKNLREYIKRKIQKDIIYV